MTSFRYFIFILFLYFVNSKQLTSENCEKVSDELSAQGKLFEEKFQLNTLKATDALCLYPGNEDIVISCCNQFTEKILVETATFEYNQIFLQEIKTLSTTLKRIHSHILNISVQTCVEFGGKLKAFIPVQYLSKERIQSSKGIVKRFVSSIISFLLNRTSEKGVSVKVQKYINQLIQSLPLNVCETSSKSSLKLSHNRKKRHFRISNSIQSNSFSFIEDNVERNLKKSVDILMISLNSTRVILQVFNVSLDILTHIIKCQKCTLPEECSINVMRMNHCSYCSGEAMSRPCFSVCLQVISGCIWKLQSLSKEWKNLFESTEKYFNKKKNQDRLFKGLADLYGNIRTKIARIYEEHTKESCLFNNNVLPIFSETLRMDMRNFASYSSYEIRHMKLFWENLAVTMCTRSTWFSSLSNNHLCWNGSEITSPQWHKCSFCQERRVRHDHVPKIMAHNIKAISSLYSDVKWAIYTLSKHTPKKSKLSLLNSKNDILLKETDMFIKSTEEALKRNKSKDNKSKWRDVGKSNFIIFDEVDGSENGEEGSGSNILSNQLKKITPASIRNTPQSLTSKLSSRNIYFLTSILLSLFSLALIHIL